MSHSLIYAINSITSKWLHQSSLQLIHQSSLFISNLLKSFLFLFAHCTLFFYSLSLSPSNFASLCHFLQCARLSFSQCSIQNGKHINENDNALPLLAFMLCLIAWHKCFVLFPLWKNKRKEKEKIFFLKTHTHTHKNNAFISFRDDGLQIGRGYEITSRRDIFESSKAL